MISRSGIWVVGLLFASAASAAPTLPLGMPPAEENPLIAKAAPDRCIAYLSWAGSATPNPESANQTEQLLAEPDVQLFADRLEKLITDLVLKEASRAGPRAEKQATLVTAWARTLLSRPGAAFLSSLAIGPSGLQIDAGLLVDLGDDADKFKAAVLGDLLKVIVDSEYPLEPWELNGFALISVRLNEDAPPIVYGMRDSLLIAAVGKGTADSMIKRLDTDPPAWLTELRKQLPVERPSLVLYADAQKIIDVANSYVFRTEGAQAFLRAMGLDDLSSVSIVSGFGEQDFVTRVRVRFQGKLSGLLSAVNAKPLAAEDLEAIPRDATFAIAARLDVGATFDAVVSALSEQQPDLPAQVEKQLEASSESTGFHLRKDLIDSLGDVWCLYHSPGEGGYLLGFAGVVGVRNPDKLAAIQQQLVDQARATEEKLERLGRESRPRYQPKLNVLAWKGSDIYSLSGLGQTPLAPSWCLTNDELIVAPFPQIIKAYLSRGEDFQSLASLPRVTEFLLAEERELVTLAYQDTPRLFRLAYPFSQFAARILSAELARDEIDVDVSLIPTGSAIAKHLTPDSIAISPMEDGFEVTVHESFPGSARVVPLALVAGSFVWMVESRDARALAESISMIVSPDAANEAIARNRLKHILLAMHNYHEHQRHFPAAFTTDKDGTPLLSWRVQILPYLEQQHLYDRFRHDEPWDSEHNKELIPLMPDVLASPGDEGEPGETSFLTIRQSESLFPGAKATRIRDVTDGTSNTMAVVEASRKSAVIWTKPDDFEINEMTRAASLFGLRKDGFLVGMADGSVQKVKAEVDDKMFGLLWNRHDAMPLDYDELFVKESNRDVRLFRPREIDREAVTTEFDIPEDEGDSGVPTFEREETRVDDVPVDSIDEGDKP